MDEMISNLHAQKIGLIDEFIAIIDTLDVETFGVEKEEERMIGKKKIETNEQIEAELENGIVKIKATYSLFNEEKKKTNEILQVSFYKIMLF